MSFKVTSDFPCNSPMLSHNFVSLLSIWCHNLKCKRYPGMWGHPGELSGQSRGICPHIPPLLLAVSFMRPLVITLRLTETSQTLEFTTTLGRLKNWMILDFNLKTKVLCIDPMAIISQKVLPLLLSTSVCAERALLNRLLHWLAWTETEAWRSPHEWLRLARARR